MEISFFDVLGVMGSILYLYSYILLQFKRDFAKSFQYSFMNFTAAGLVLVSLCQHFNLAAVICNISWGAISLYGMYKSRKHIADPLETLEAVVEKALPPLGKGPDIP